MRLEYKNMAIIAYGSMSFLEHMEYLQVWAEYLRVTILLADLSDLPIEEVFEPLVSFHEIHLVLVLALVVHVVEPLTHDDLRGGQDLSLHSLYQTLLHYFQ